MRGNLSAAVITAKALPILWNIMGRRETQVGIIRMQTCPWVPSDDSYLMSVDMSGKKRSSRQRTPPREANLHLKQGLADFLDVGKDIHSHQEIWFYSHTSGAFQRAFPFLLDLDWSSATDSWHLMGLCVCMCNFLFIRKNPSELLCNQTTASLTETAIMNQDR